MNEKKSPFSELSQLGNEALNLLKTAKRVAESSGAVDKAVDKAREIALASATELERAVANVRSAAEHEWNKLNAPSQGTGKDGTQSKVSADGDPQATSGQAAADAHIKAEDDLGSGI
jgi:hypothetical protein